MNIIIPIGGVGQRFKDLYGLPKPLINIHGKPMIEHVISSFRIKDDDKLIIIYNKPLNQYDLDKIIKTKFTDAILIEMTKQTEGAVETLLFGLNWILLHNSNLLERKTIIVDCDTIYNMDIVGLSRAQADNTVFYFKDEGLEPIYSYIQIDDVNRVVDVQEKNKISSNANTGCYLFKSSLVLKQYCEIIIKNNIRHNGEYYMSCILKEILNRRSEVLQAYLINKEDFDCVGTPFQLQLYSILKPATGGRRYCFDLDNTLVTYPTIPGDYSTVKPKYKNIKMLKHLKDNNNTIIIYTARRMKTFSGNVGNVIRDIGKITLDTLESFSIPYDELYFGKPYADYYIDDLAINATEDLEKSLGYYMCFIKERNCNKIEITQQGIKKTTSLEDGLRGEIYFYKNMPENIHKYFPKIIETQGNSSYTMEKINGISLSHYFLNELLTEKDIINLLTIIKDIHKSHICKKKFNIYLNYSQKLTERYTTYDYTKFDNHEKKFQDIVSYLDLYEKNDQGIAGVIHGDPVFSNIILNENRNFKFIDMRGIVGKELTIFGDIFYDYSKIYQSLIGYDEILLEKYISNSYRDSLVKVFNAFILSNFGEKYITHIQMITKSLIFSLIPIHNDSKIYEYFKLLNS